MLLPCQPLFLLLISHLARRLLRNHTQRPPDVTRRRCSSQRKELFLLLFCFEGTQNPTFFPIAKNLQAPWHSKKKKQKQKTDNALNPSDHIQTFPLPLRKKKKVRRWENEFKHLFKQKLQTTPPFNLSKKDNDKLVFSQSVRAGISCVPL